MFTKHGAAMAFGLLLPILSAAGATIAGSMGGVAITPLEVEMRAERWEPNGTLAFSRDQDHPHGILSVKGGGAILKDVDFRDGTIEYDIEEYPDNEGIPGIWFRQQGTEAAENFYLRTDADCPRSIECIQYAPVSHRNVEWDVYPEFQAAAPVHAKGWNHVKLVISGKRMNVFINGEAAPSLKVGKLAGDATSGALQLWGDAMYANLTIPPGATEGLPPSPLADPAKTDSGFVRHWSVSPASRLARGDDAPLAAMPPASAPWESIAAEDKGFVNLGRRHGSYNGVPDLIWLKTTIGADAAHTTHVSLGWAREIWIYVNGKRVFADRNLYYPASGRKPPLGRMSLENGGFDLPLRPGKNEVAIAISDDLGSMRHWGWGLEFHIDDLSGLTMGKGGPGM
jgi:hypothetical protein